MKVLLVSLSRRKEELKARKAKLVETTRKSLLNGAKDEVETRDKNKLKRAF